MEEKILGNRIHNVYNWIISSEEAMKADPNAFELAELFIETNDLRLKGLNISEEAKDALDFIWNNRKENVATNGFSYNNLFFKILESCYDGELANIILSEEAKLSLKKMAAVDLYIAQRRKLQPNYMHDNKNEMLEINTLIKASNLENDTYLKFVNEFESVLFNPVKQNIR